MGWKAFCNFPVQILGSRGEALSWLRRVRSNLAGKMEILVYGISRTSSILFHEFDLTVALDWH